MKIQVYNGTEVYGYDRGVTARYIMDDLYTKGIVNEDKTMGLCGREGSEVFSPFYRVEYEKPLEECNLFLRFCKPGEELISLNFTKRYASVILITTPQEIMDQLALPKETKLVVGKAGNIFSSENLNKSLWYLGIFKLTTLKTEFEKLFPPPSPLTLPKSDLGLDSKVKNPTKEEPCKPTPHHSPAKDDSKGKSVNVSSEQSNSKYITISGVLGFAVATLGVTMIYILADYKEQYTIDYIINPLVQIDACMPYVTAAITICGFTVTSMLIGYAASFQLPKSDLYSGAECSV